jgi:predicted RNA-binding Zn ribbon-like protein
MCAAMLFDKSLMMRAERLCLEFANTVSWHASDHPEDWFPTYLALAEWAERIGLLTARQAARMRREAELRPAQAQAVLERARALRETIYRVFSALAHGRQPEKRGVDALVQAAAEALAHARLAAGPAGFAWTWPAEAGELDQCLWPVAHSAVDLLTSPEAGRVGQCADDRGCGWLFLDMTKNRSRRWCDMRDCGNRAKARRHYARRKAV